MIKKYNVYFVVCLLFLVVSACGNSDNAIESGTYTGTVDKVEAEETEIYVEADNGERLELYFTDTTKLTQNGKTVPFDTLQKGMKVQVEVEQTGSMLKPIAVEILE